MFHDIHISCSVESNLIRKKLRRENNYFYTYQIHRCRSNACHQHSNQHISCLSLPLAGSLVLVVCIFIVTETFLGIRNCSRYIKLRLSYFRLGTINPFSSKVVPGNTNCLQASDAILNQYDPEMENFRSVLW